MMAIPTEPSLSAFAPVAVRAAAAAWPRRAAEELRSALLFRALAHAARTAGEPFAAWEHPVWHIVRDQLRHARLCAEVGASLGAEPPRHDAAAARARLAWLATPRRRAAHLLLVEFAVGETVAMAIYRARRRAAREPLTHDVLSSILTDQAHHAHVGWAALAACWPALDENERVELRDDLTRSLAALEVELAAMPDDPELAPLGVLTRETRLGAFHDAVERQVRPQLATLGLDYRVE
jgi:hypothetical protein